MKVTKLGHCCLLIETSGLRIVTDPGCWSDGKQNSLKDIDLIIITHEHADHFDIDSLRIMLANNPSAQVVTNTSVGKLLTAAKIGFDVIESGQSNSFSGVEVAGYGYKHAEIYEDYGMVQNTGYFIDKTLFYPGDAFINPGRKVSLLALPIAGPWLSTKEVINYAKEIAPQHAFCVHDGMLGFIGPYHSLPTNLLKDQLNWHAQTDLQSGLVLEI